MKKAWFFSLLILAAVLGVVLTNKPSPSSAAQSSTGVPPVVELPRQAGRLPYTSNPAPAESTNREADHLAPFFSAPIALQDGGAKRPFELATDELYVRQADGNNSVVKVPKTERPEDFAAAIQKARADHGSEPELVLYPVGLPRNESTRRIVTREVVVNAPTRAEADTLAAAQGIVFQKAPEFAKNTYIYEAPTSVDALRALTKQSSPVAAAPLLASLAARKSMPNDPFVHLQWHLKYQGQKGAVEGTDINVESVWNYPSVSAGNYTRGANVTIGIVDDGLQWSHPDLSANMRNELNWDWNGKDSDPSPNLEAGDDHGTACAGVAAARGNNRIGVSGVAPEASLVGLRLTADINTDLDEAEAMAWKKDQIEIKSNSWGPSDRGFILKAPDNLTLAALKYAADFGRSGRGTIIIFAGGNGRAPELDDDGEFVIDDDGLPAMLGNDNSNYDGYANSIYTIAVAAMDSNGLQSSYSESGANLIVSAPSDGGPLGVMTTDNKGRHGYNYGIDVPLDVQFGLIPPVDDFKGAGDVTKNFSGTSAACPVVSGVVALMLEKNPDLGWRDVQEILIRSAKKIDDQFPSGTVNNTATGWITSNRSAGPNPVSGNSSVPFHFNHKYGAGLVDADEAVKLAANWNNLGPQKSQTVSTTVPLSIAPGATVNRTFTVNGDDLRLEHVTLQLTIDNIFKGDLEITLTSPDGTTSVFCEPHSDNLNNFTNWTFMTVRNWGESSNGDWTLTITNHGATAGNLTAAELVVYGTDSDALVDPPVVTLQASETSLFVGSNLTLTATAKDKINGDVEKLEAFAGAEPLGASSNGTWTIQANKAGNYTFTVNATDKNGSVATSNSVEVEVLETPIAAWDFDTATISPVPLATAVQGTKQYAANFGSGNLIFNGNSSDDNLWSFKDGEIWKGVGTTNNARGEMWNDPLNNNALLLRRGKNTPPSQGKCLIFEFSMVNRGQLNVSYTLSKNSGGFTTHTWSYSTDGTNWINPPLQTVSPAGSTVVLNPILELAEQAKAYLRVQFTGATAVSGENIIDNIYFSASPITVDPVSEDFTVLSRSTKAQGNGLGSQDQANETREAAVPVQSPDSEKSQNLDWELDKPSIHIMVVHAEVVEGSQFLNEPGSLLSASEDGKVLGLAEPVPQTSRYDLGITSSDPAPAPLRLKVYDSKSKGILVLEEKVPFAPGATIGSPSTPKRYKVAYQEVEQVVPVSPGWNTFTTAVNPDPASLAGAFANYDYSEGDQLFGPGFEATVVDGKWSPVGVKLEPKTTYSLLRQDSAASQIVLRGKAVEETAAPQPVKPVELPAVKTSANSSNPGHSHSAAPAPAASSGGGSESVTKSANSSKGSKKAKSSSSSKKKSGKKTKAKTS